MSESFGLRAPAPPRAHPVAGASASPQLWPPLPYLFVSFSLGTGVRKASP